MGLNRVRKRREVEKIKKFIENHLLQIEWVEEKEDKEDAIQSLIIKYERSVTSKYRANIIPLMDCRRKK